MRSATYLSIEDLPPLEEIAAALHVVTERLAREMGSPTTVPPLWSEFEWQIAQAVATMQGISSLLHSTLQWKGPLSWERFIAEQKNHIEGRQRRIEGLLGRIDECSRRKGISIVALKGSALHARGIYSAGQRPMADIDLLVRERDISATAHVLEDCGYELTFTTWRHRLFEAVGRHRLSAFALGEHVDNPIKIELHSNVQERLPVQLTDITDHIYPKVPCAGINDYASTASLMMHLLLHAAGNIRAHALRQIQLNDIALLAKRFGDDDWIELAVSPASQIGLWWAVLPLALVERYYPGSIPTHLSKRAAAHCPRWLRRAGRRQLLTDVSWSNLRVYALPGVEWCRSPKELLSFVVSRIWPKADAREELRRFASNHPGAADISWYGISQVARVLQYLTSKPPRVQTLLVVRAALAQSQISAPQ